MFKAHFANQMDMWEEEGKVIDFEGVEPVTDEYVNTNKSEYRKRLLEGDTAALKHALLSVDRLLTTGNEKLREEIEKIRKNGSKNINKVSVTYSDGSTVSFTAGIMKTPDPKNEINTHAIKPEYPGPWNQADMIAEQIVEKQGSYVAWGSGSLKKTPLLEGLRGQWILLFM